MNPGFDPNSEEAQRTAAMQNAEQWAAAEGKPAPPAMSVDTRPAMATAQPGDAPLLGQGQQAESSVAPPFPGTPGSVAGPSDETTGFTIGNDVINMAAPFIPTSPRGGAGPAVMPEGENMLPFGGAQGRELWNNAAVQKPSEIEAAVMQGANAEERMGKEKADFYTRLQHDQQEQLGLIKQNRIENDKAVAARQAQLDKAITGYSNDLADRGQFWRNPGNIIAALGVAFTTLGTQTAAGANKIINDMVQSDWQQRKQLADMHLGELRSNINGYRQLAGDKEMGDRLALADSYRVAAMEADRIGAQFQGPIAKAKAAAVVKELQRNYLVQMGQLHAQMAYVKPHAENPMVAQEYQKSGQALPGTGFTPYAPTKGYAQPGAGQPSDSSTGATAGSTRSSGAIWDQQAPSLLKRQPGGSQVQQAASSGGGAQGAQAAQAAAKETTKSAGYATDQQRYDLDKRYPGSSAMVDSERKQVIPEILASIGANPRGVNPLLSDEEISKTLPYDKQVAYNKAIAGYRKWASEDNDKVSKAMQQAGVPQRLSGTRMLGSDIQILQEVARRKNMSVDELRDTRTKQIIGTGNYKTINEWLGASPANGIHEEQAKNLANALNRFDQLLAGQVNSYTHANAGGAVSPSEEKRIQALIAGDHSWASVNNFYDMQSREVQDLRRNALAGAASKLSVVKWNSDLGQDPQPLGFNGIPGPPETGASPAYNGQGNASKNPNDGAKTRAEIIKAAQNRLLFTPDQQRKLEQAAQQGNY